jgi:hypothetical protein
MGQIEKLMQLEIELAYNFSWGANQLDSYLKLKAKDVGRASPSSSLRVIITLSCSLLVRLYDSATDVEPENNLATSDQRGQHMGGEGDVHKTVT